MPDSDARGRAGACFQGAILAAGQLLPACEYQQPDDRNIFWTAVVPTTRITRISESFIKEQHNGKSHTAECAKRSPPREERSAADSAELSFCGGKDMPALVPRPITWEIIEKSRNQAVLPLLAAGLASASPETRKRCLQSLLARPEPLARKQVVLAWDSFVESEITYIRSRMLHFQDVASEILAVGSLDEQRRALAAITGLLLSGCLPAVLPFVLTPLHPLQPQASDCLLKLCSYWGSKARAEEDQPSVRGPMLEVLYACLLDYAKHKNTRIVDAWLALVHWDDSLQRRLLADPGHCAFGVVVERLRHARDAQLQKLIAGYLLRSTTPLSIQKLICEKTEPRLALQLAEMVDTRQWPNLKHRLRELPPLACLQSLESGLPEMLLGERKRLWLLLSVSSKDYGQVLRGAVQLAKLGTSEGRHAAAEMVRNCRKPDFAVMVGDLQNALAGIAKPNAAGPALLETALWAQSASLPLQRAAQELFKDFTLERLIEQVSHWPTTMCKAMGHVVGIANPDITSFLVKQLESPSPKRRLAALRATQMLCHSEAVAQHLLPMLQDPRLEVRVRVINLLSELDGDMLEPLIPMWLGDVSTDIQEAALRAARRRERLKKTQASPQLSGVKEPR
jgi:hypothetical protein